MHKKLMMACMAIAAFAAFVVAPTASASPVLTHEGIKVPPGTTIVGTLTENAVFTGAITVTCTKAVLTGTVIENSGTKIKGEIPAGKASFTGTSGTGTECSSTLAGAPVVVTVNSKLCLETVEKTDTVLTTGCEVETNPITEPKVLTKEPVVFTLNLTGNGPCKYSTASVTGTFKTGEPATVKLSEQEAKKVEGGFFCPSSGKLDMDFDLYTDDNLHKSQLTIS
jgi:hypothetical protein